MEPDSKQDAMIPSASPFPDRARDTGKRTFDTVFSSIGLVFLSPLFLVIAAAIKLADRGPIFYRQTRVGLNGTPFEILKFRTMVTGADKIGPAITKGEDPRITRVGRLLRRTKLDELPQLWNVLRGEMSFVGPRPEVPRYVALYSDKEKPVLGLKPGITDLASLAFRNEEQLLRHAGDVETFYREVCLPQKARLNLEYARTATLWSDIALILRTVLPASLTTLASYAGIMMLSMLLATVMASPAPPSETVLTTLVFCATTVPLQISCIVWQKIHCASHEIFASDDAGRLAIAIGLPATLLGAARFFIVTPLLPPAPLVVLNALICFGLLIAFRLTSRMPPIDSDIAHVAVTPDKRIAIIGAGSAGATIAASLLRRGVNIQAFFDDNPRRWHRLIRGCVVAGMPECLLTDWRQQVDEVIIATPDVTTDRSRQLRDLIHRAGLKAIIPTWVAGRKP